MKNKTVTVWLFYAATAALLLFGIVLQLLCDGMGYGHGFGKYLLELLPAWGVFLLLWGAVGNYGKLHKVFRILIAVLLIFLLLWTVLGYYVVVDAHLDEDQFMVYEMYAWTYPVMDVRDLLARAHFFGRGEPYYEYPEEIMEGYDPKQEDLPLDVRFAFGERNRAKTVFGNYRVFRTLPVLSYTYGLWVNWMYALLSAAWCAAALLAVFRLKKWWEVVLWLFFSGFFALQLLLPLLGAFGCINNWSSHPFAANAAQNIMFIAPQLGILWGLLREKR